jgi:hypothetical protein
MQLDWILSPVAQYAFLAIALIGCLVLFLSMKMEISMVRRSFTESGESAKAAAETAAKVAAETAAEAAAKAAAATLAVELATLRQEMESTAAGGSTGQELNLTRRAQALRMEHRGESPSTIAAALRVPRNEIDLLLKIQRLASEAPASGGK